MKTLTRILVVFLVTVLVGLAMLPLAQTGWAEGTRTGMSEHAPDGRPEGPEMLPAGMSFFAGLLKPTLFLLIPGSITLGILNTTRRRKKMSVAKKAVLAD